MSVVKRFDITQTVRAQLHFEVYNAFNQTFYGNPESEPAQCQLRQGHQPEQRAGEPADRLPRVLLSLLKGGSAATGLTADTSRTSAPLPSARLWTRSIPGVASFFVFTLFTRAPTEYSVPWLSPFQP